MRILPLLVLTACVGTPEIEDPAADPKVDAQAFLDEYSAGYQEKYYAWQLAEWEANTRIVEGDDTAMKAAAAAREAYAAHTGSVEAIETARKLLEKRDQLDPIQVRQLEQVLYYAGANPQTVPETVKKLIDAEGKQVQTLYGFTFQLDGKPVTPNDIDRLLRESDDLAERRKVWEASKEVGPTLKPGLVEIRGLRNETVRALGYPDFYSYKVSSYGMDDAEMQEMMTRLQRELRPLYRELHTYMRYELAKKYGEPVPEQLPAHWLPNRWAQDWTALVEVEGVDLDAALKDKEPEWIVKTGEDLYVSLGFEPLPASFWEKSSLYPVPPDAGFKKNTHASAWHLDLDQDIRSLMSVEPNSEWYETSAHELGHIYYFRAYTRPEVPVLLREGANRAYHEAVGTQMGLAAMQQPFLVGRGLVPPDQKPDEIQTLLREALNYVVFIPFSAGTMMQFERELYVNELPPDQWNAKWWELAGKYQGIAPPAPRGEEYADALTKTHINDDPAEYYDYALSTFLLFQLHDHIATEILKQDPRATDYYGSKETGDFLRSILEPGATRDWRELTREATGEDLTAEPMLRYYEPLMKWLQEQNEGRTHTLPEL